MHKEYAVELIEERRNAPKRWSEWASEYRNSIRFITIQLVRSFNLRHKRDVDMLHAIYSRYGLAFDFSEQAAKAEAYFREHGHNSNDLCHVTIKAAKGLANKAESEGLEAFVDCLDGELSTPWRWESTTATGNGALTFADRDRLCAVPTIGGILSEEGVAKLSKRFPDAVLLPVSEALANAHLRGDHLSWMVVAWEGRGVAVAADEAKALGLSEAPNWFPDLTGVPAVPTRKDFAKIGL